MDYSFHSGSINKPRAVFTMPHEAMGHLFNDAMQHIDSVNACLTTIEELTNGIKTSALLQYEDWQLTLDRYEAELINNTLTEHYYQEPDEELDEGWNLYNEEEQCGCGLEDFEQALRDWRDFLLKYG